MGVPIHNVQEIILGDSIPMNGNFFSPDFEIRYFDLGSLQCVWTGADTSAAQIIPQASNDRVNWCDLVSGTTIKKTSVGSGCCMYFFNDTPSAWFRWSFVGNGNTTGTITGYAIFKKRIS